MPHYIPNLTYSIRTNAFLDGTYRSSENTQIPSVVLSLKHIFYGFAIEMTDACLTIVLRICIIGRTASWKWQPGWANRHYASSM